MIRALLLDLDDTLLINDWDAFFPPYLEALVRHMAPLMPGTRFMAAFDAGTRAMVRSDGTQGTLDRVFGRVFLEQAGSEPTETLARFSAFYADEFDQLQAYTAQDPAALELVTLAREANLKLAVATQPLFPLEAVMARLRWAGVPHEQVAYEHLAAYDVHTVCKPAVGYFESVLADLGVSPHEALMAGDSASADMPARRLGIKTYYVERGRDGAGQTLTCDARGSLAGLVELLRSGAIHEL